MSEGMIGNNKSFMVISLFVYLILFICSICVYASASDNVETEIKFNLIDGTNLEIVATIDVNSITLPANGITYSKSDIQSLSSSNPEMIGAIKISVKGIFLNQLQESFPESTIISLQELPTYDLGIFYDSYQISLLPSFFSIEDSMDIHSLINGFLDCGAYINYSYTLTSYLGWNQSFTFILPSYIGYKQTNGNVQQNHITWVLKPIESIAKKNAQLTLLETAPTTPYSTNESLEAQIIMDCTDSKHPLLTIQFLGFSINTSSYHLLPDFISNVKSLPADAMRLAVLQNITSWEIMKNLTFNPAVLQIKPFLENSSFNQKITLVSSWINSTTGSALEPFNISKMDSIPPITINYQDDTINFTICNISSRAVYGLINAGAHINISQENVNIGDNLDQIKYNYNGTLIFPEHVFLDDYNIFHWDKNTPIKGEFKSTNSPKYNNYNISSNYEITMKSTDLNLLSFFTGRNEISMAIYLKQTEKRNITEIPFHFSLPEEIHLSFLNSDAFRVCYYEHIFTKEQIQQFISYQNSAFQSRCKSLFPLTKGRGNFDQYAFDESLKWDGNISSMEGVAPIVITSSMNTAFPLAFDFSVIPPKVIIEPLNLSFSGIPNQDITYSMEFPKGISIDLVDTLERAQVKKNDNGNMYFSLSFDASEGGIIDNVLIDLHPSGLYILGIFAPCFISIFITGVLLILVFIIRKKRRTRPPSQRDILSQDYEQEEYYIPPASPSKKR